MRLFIMRHGPAEEQSASGRDHNRRLSPRGRVRTERVAAELVRRGERPARILSSSLVRARETAGIVVAALGGNVDIEIHGKLAPSESGLPLVRALATAGVESALCVSHAPDVSILAEALLNEHVGSFDAAMILGLRIDASAAAELFVIQPAALDP